MATDLKVSLILFPAETRKAWLAHMSLYCKDTDLLCKVH